MTETVRHAAELRELNESVRRGDWVSPESSMVPGGTALLGPAPDPVDALAQTNIPGLVEQLQPLREAQGWFAGDPGAVTGYLEPWYRVAELARQANELFDASVRRNTTDWTGTAGESYREQATARQDDLDMLVEAADSIITLVTAAGDMAGSARADIQESVTECVNDIIGRLPDYYNVLNSGHPAALNYVLADVAAIVDAWA